MKKSKILVLLLIFLLALSAFACSSGVNVDDYSVTTSDTEEPSSSSSTVTPANDRDYKITVGECENGSVTVEGNAQTAKRGETVVFVVGADSGYELAWIKVNDGNDLKSKVVSGKLSVVMPEMDITVTAKFGETGKINSSSYAPVKDDTQKEDNLFSAVRETAQNGQFTLSAYNDIRYGNTVNVTATPDAGYKVKEVTVTTRENNSQTVTVHGNHNDWAFVMPKANVNVKVTFEKELYEITVADVDGVKITLNKTSAYFGDEISITDVTVDDGYTLLRLEANGVVVTDDKFTMPAGNVTLKAVIEKQKYTVTVGTHAHGQVEIEGGLEHEFGETVVISLTPDENYQLDGIEVVTDSAKTVPLNGLTFVMPAENVHIVISFKEATAKYDITINSVEHGKITSDKEQAVFGEKVTLTATPDDRYELALISVKAGTTDIVVTNNSFAMPESNVEVTATFVEKSYPVTVVSASGSTSLNKSYKWGEKVTFTVTPDDGYEVASVTLKVEGQTAQTLTRLSTGYEFTMPEANVQISVSYVVKKYALIISETANGSVSVSNTGSEFAEGELISVLVEPSEGYYLKSLTYNGVDILSEKQFTMPAGVVTVNAEFEKRSYKITVDVTSGDGSGSVTATSYNPLYQDSVTLTITPANGFALTQIYVSGVNVTSQIVNGVYTFDMPAHDVVITAVFETSAFAINLNQPEVGGTISSTLTSARYNAEIVLSIELDTGYSLTNFVVTRASDGGAVELTKVSDTSYKFLMPSGNVNVTAVTEKVSYAVNVTVNGEGGTASADKTTAYYNDEVTLTITPENGYRLKGVTGVTLKDGNKFSMPANAVTVVVEFEKIPYNINTVVTGGVGGSVDVKSTAVGGEVVTVTVTPATGYKLKSLTGVTLQEGKFTMPASDVTITVEFELIEYTLSIKVDGGNGTATIEGDKTSATYNETISVTVTPENGYVLNTVTVNGSTISGTSFNMPAGNVEIVVTFKVGTVTASAGTCTNGSVSISPSGTVSYGATVTLTATPSTGYELDYFTANGEKIVGGGSTYTVTSNVEFKAVFKAKSYTLTVQHKCGDTLLQTETLTMTFGTSTTVNAKTIEGYTATSSSISVTMDTEGKTVTVSYNKNSYTLTVQHIIQGDGSAFATTETYTVAYGDKKTVNPVSLTAYNGLIKASEGSKTVTMGASNQTVTYAYSLDTTKKFSANTSTGAIPVITAKTGFSVTYKITDDTAYSIGDWCKVFSIKNANVFTGCINWFDDNGTFVDDWFDGNHGHGNNDAYGTTYNYDAAIKEGCVYTISFNTDGSIDWYRNGLRVLYFDATTKNNTKTISDYVSFMISGAKSSGIKFENGAQTNDGGNILNKTNVSDCYVGYAIDKKTVTISYSFSGTDEVSRGNSVYYMAPGYAYTFNTAMSGYTASKSSVVTGTGTSAESYSVTYTRNATTSTSVLSTPVLVARKGITGVSGLVKVNGISGDFFMQAKLTDVYQMQSATDSWRSILVGIYNNSNNSLGRYLRFDRFSWSIGSPYGEWTQGYNGMSSVLQSVMQGRSDILITITKTGTTVVVGYKVYSYANSTTYYMDFLIESVSGTVDVGFGGEDCTYTLEYINMEKSTGTVAVDTSAMGTTIYNKDNTNGGWTDGRVRTTIRTGLTGNFNATINLYQLTYSSGLKYTDANWRTAILAIYGWCDYSHVTVLRQDGHWWCDGGGDTGNSAVVTSSDTSMFTGNTDNGTGTKFADITRNAYIQITVVGTNVGTSSGKIVVTYNINSLNPDYKNTQYWLKYEISGVTRSWNDGYNTSSIDLVMLCEFSSYVVYSYSVS